MSNNSVLGFLSSKLSSSSENIATEALSYILQNSENARSAFAKYLEPILDLDSDLFFQTQVIGDLKDIPDLVGVDDKSRERLIVESKFWAGLTGNQPVTYLQRLPSSSSSALLFIAPFRRFSTLWPEIIRRCSEAGISYEEIHIENENLLAGKIGDNHAIALSSWDGLLEFMRREAEAAGDFSITNDILQLRGLAVRMDQEAFIPIQSKELSAGHGARLLQYLGLIDDAVELMKQDGLVSTKGLKSTMARGRYTRYFSIPDFGLALEFHPKYWSSYLETPIWMSIWKPGGKRWGYSEEGRRLLQPLIEETPPRLIRDGKKLIVPIYLPIGKEREQVLESIINQVRKIIAMLKP